MSVYACELCGYEYRPEMGDPDNGWGWIADKGFDIIQTDWSLPLRQYLDGRK